MSEVYEKPLSPQSSDILLPLESTSRLDQIINSLGPSLVLSQTPRVQTCRCSLFDPSTYLSLLPSHDPIAVVIRTHLPMRLFLVCTHLRFAVYCLIFVFMCLRSLSTRPLSNSMTTRRYITASSACTASSPSSSSLPNVATSSTL